MTIELKPASETDVAHLMKGAVDLHCHSGPSVTARVVDHIDARLVGLDANMKAETAKVA